MNVLSDKQIKQADAYTIRNQNISSEALMERAATKIFQWISENYPSDSIEEVILFAVRKQWEMDWLWEECCLKPATNQNLYFRF